MAPALGRREGRIQGRNDADACGTIRDLSTWTAQVQGCISIHPSANEHPSVLRCNGSVGVIKLEGGSGSASSAASCSYPRDRARSHRV